jgi:MoaA/NifB/PqqE/SkfB family radical SAM enzyme
MDNSAMNIAAISLKLVLRAILYRFYKFSGYSPAPEALSLEITQRCIARCIMCNIWKSPHDARECSHSDWTELLSSPVFRKIKELDITGGEPFLKDDLALLLKNICSLKTRHLCELKTVAVTTNGFLTSKILSVLEEISAPMKKKEIDLVIVFAMDAIGELHNRIRKVERGWQKLEASIHGAIELRKKYGNIVIGLKTTILPVNINELNAISEYAEQNGLFTIISPCIITDNRYNNTDLKKDLIFSEAEISKMIRFFEDSSFRWSYHREVLLGYLRNHQSSKPCSAGFNYYFIRSTGHVFPCPLIKYNLGNYIETPIGAIFSSKAAGNFRRIIGSFEECSSCTEPGLERYALPFEGYRYIKLLLKSGKSNFLALHKHMGLDKYI